MILLLRPAAVGILAVFFAIVASAQNGVPCADRSVAASAIRTTEDIRAFVQCAYELVQRIGADAAYRAFHEDPRWRHGPYYVFVDSLAPTGDDSKIYVFPPDPSREGSTWGAIADEFGGDVLSEEHRVATLAGSGWTYASFENPETGTSQPKASYVIEIDWKGNRALLGAGIYRPDLPGTCGGAEVSASRLERHPSDQALREFVRCAAFMVESKGYLAKAELETSPRWADASIYVFVMDAMGNQVMSGNRFRVNGVALHEWGASPGLADPFGGRDMVSVGNTFGESFVYYETLNPTTLSKQGKVGMLKRVVAQGVPLLVGAGYYVSPDRTAASEKCADNNVTAAGIVTRADIQAFVRCAEEYVAEHGPEEAYRAFHEDERWRQGPYYVFVDGLERSWDDSAVHVFPPEPSREGGPWQGGLVDNFGNDYFFELHRVMSLVDAGWIHYSFTNFSEGRDEPKSSYVAKIDWNGLPAAIGAGIYLHDLPGTCNRDEVNAAILDANPSERKLREFVRCAAMEMESKGLFAGPVLERDPRWRHGSVSVSTVNAGTGVIEFSGDPGAAALSGRIPELLFNGRDLVSVSDVFGESYWYYSLADPATGQPTRIVSFAKRVLAHGVPMLVISGYPLADGTGKSSSGT